MKFYRKAVEASLGEDHPRRGEEAEVRLVFDIKELGAEGMEKLYKVQELLGELGVSFDTGSDGKYRDWEWDWSLSGPVKVTFVRFTEDNPKNRHTRPWSGYSKKAAEVEQVLINKLS